MIHLPTGQTMVIAQFCNDWFTVRGQVEAVSPLDVQLDATEIDLVRAAARDGLAGHMLVLFDLGDDGRFTRRAD